MIAPIAMTHPDHFLLAGVMGDPITHSRSPKLHNYWLAKYSLTGAYMPLAIAREHLRAALRALPALGFSGCNLTIPHKEAALRIVDNVDPLARRIGAVNGVVVAADGSLEGHNYDAFGYIESVREAQPSWRADTGPIVVIGAGGGARAVLLGLTDQGAREIRLVNRTLARAEALADELGGPITALNWEERERALVSDIVYIPRETALIAAARKRGNPTVNGLGMLLHQARPAFQAWFGIMPEVTPELRAIIEAT